MKNKIVAEIFRQISKLLDLKGENPFRVKAYEKASQNIESLTEDIETIASQGKLTSIPGIGQDLANKIKEIIKTGTLTQYEELKKTIPEGLLKLLEIPGLGPKTVKTVYEKLKIDSIEKLEEAAKKGLLRRLEGIKEKTEENILKGIELLKKGRERAPLYIALSIAEEFLSELRKMKEVKKIEVAGSVRRKKETIKDIDILIISDNHSKIMDRFVGLESVKEIVAKGETKSSVISKTNNMQVDLRVVNKESFGSALMYFTGSKDFNIKFRQLAIKRGLKVNEYGIFKNTRRVAGRTEEEIFELFRMQFIPPELREDRGEIELALKNKLPQVVELKDIKGDFHIHSKYSDGNNSIEEIASYAKKLGYQYAGICDHSQSLKVAGGLSRDKVYKKIEEIKKLNQTLRGITILCGTEVDILNDGKLDYPDSLLKEFDLVIAAIHSGFKQSRAQLTKRLVAACKNRYVNIIAHPTGRLFGVRDSYDIDWEEVLKAAKDYNVAMEINTYPQRLDLNDTNCMKASSWGVKLALGTDAHILDQTKSMELGVSVARRAWLEKKDIINCRDIKALLKWLKK